MKWKDILYCTRSERRGLMGLLLLVFLIYSPAIFLPHRQWAPLEEDKNYRKEYDSFMASLQEEKSVRAMWPKKYPHHYTERKVVLSPFDPNVTDSAGFTRLGLPPWMAHNILRYREKGGKFRRATDFRKVYGLTEKQYNTLLPYIVIADDVYRVDTVRVWTERLPADTVKSIKYPKGTVIPLNRADTTELKKIPGIGSGIARRIVGYRKLLGGFFRVDQLADIQLSVEMLQPWLTVEPDETERINLNKASIERIHAHPYINFYQAKVIVEYRSKNGGLKSLQQLKLYEEFTTLDLERIAPYVCF